MRAGYFNQFSLESIFNDMQFINGSVTLSAFDVGKYFQTSFASKFGSNTTILNCEIGY